MREQIEGLGTVGMRCVSWTTSRDGLWQRLGLAPIGTRIVSEHSSKVYTKSSATVWDASDGDKPLTGRPGHIYFTWVSFPDDETGPNVGDLLPIDSDANLQAALNAAEVGTVVGNEKARDLVLLFIKQTDGQWHRPTVPGRNGASAHTERTYSVESFNTNCDYHWVSFPEVPKTDVQKIGQALIAEATRRSWCPDYDRFIAALNETLDEKLPAR